MQHRGRVLIAGGAIGALVFSAMAVLWGPVAPANAARLVAYDDCSELASDLRRDLAASAQSGWLHGTNLGSERRDLTYTLQSLATESTALPMTGGGDGYAAVGQGATGTNLQEAAVDEPDTAKLADGRLVVLSQDQLHVLSAGRDPRILGTLSITPATAEWESSTDSARSQALDVAYGVAPSAGATAFMLFGDRAVVIASGSRPIAPAPPMPTPEPTVTPTVVPPPTSVGPTPTLIPTPPTTSPETSALPTPLPDPAPEPVPTEPSPGPLPSEQAPLPLESGSAMPAADDTSRPVAYTVRLLLVDLSSDQPRILEEREQDGSYIDARVIGGRLQLVSRSAPSVAVPELTATTKREFAAATDYARQLARQAPIEDLVPYLTRTDADGTVLEQGQAVRCDGISRPSEGDGGAGLLTVTTIDPAQGLASVGAQSVVTDGDTVYASSERLVVATSPWSIPLSGWEDQIDPEPYAKTQLHTFDLTGEAPRYLASGEVDGRLINRWALSWHDGVLRAATTTDARPSETGRDRPSESRVVKFEERDGELVEIGRVEGLGKTEEITAVRYFGDVAVVITFRETDPLYVVDLSGDPKVTGELKITGFSSYLHPLGGDLLLGVGTDATETGEVTGHQASVFDLSDPSSPKLVDRMALARGLSELPVETDSRAFAYDPQNRTAYVPLHQWPDDLAIGPEGYVQRSMVRNFTISEDGRLALRPDIALTDYGASARVLIGDDVVHAIDEQRVVTVDRQSAQPVSQVALPTLVP